MNKECIARFNKEKLGLYEIALSKYNDLYDKYDLYIEKELDYNFYRLISRDDLDKTEFWNIYDELKTQAELMEYVLKKNGIIDNESLTNKNDKKCDYHKVDKCPLATNINKYRAREYEDIMNQHLKDWHKEGK
ncbi:hypothetical protein H8J86_07895 [Clostridium perfringens]|uniref:hypothetical protein n=1 Tax=Clostridium perfringens TaxID=1502 RepID=UPI0018E47655|nr:hypothetical protein [Clostridium perfringens]MBI6005873.1 hypothetical protein [Clostridium perfringens]